MIFFFNDTATTEIYTLSLHDALPISTTTTASSSTWCSTSVSSGRSASYAATTRSRPTTSTTSMSTACCSARVRRSEEHTSELQSRQYLVCRLLLEKKNKNQNITPLH